MKWPNQNSEFEVLKDHRRQWMIAESFPWRRKSPSQHRDKSRILWKRCDCKSIQSRDAFCKYSGFTTGCKPLVIFKSRKDTLRFDWKHVTKWVKLLLFFYQFWNNLYQNNRIMLNGEKKNSSWSKEYIFIHQTWTFCIMKLLLM